MAVFAVLVAVGRILFVAAVMVNLLASKLLSNTHTADRWGTAKRSKRSNTRDTCGMLRDKVQRLSSSNFGPPASPRSFLN